MWATVCKKCKKYFSHEDTHFFQYFTIMVDCAEILGFKDHTVLYDRWFFKDAMDGMHSVGEKKLFHSVVGICTHFVNKNAEALTKNLKSYKDSVESFHSIQQTFNNHTENFKGCDVKEFLKGVNHMVLAGVLLECIGLVMLEHKSAKFKALKSSGLLGKLYEWLLGWEHVFFKIGYYFHEEKLEIIKHLEHVLAHR